jgi:hypothetical protein
MKILDGDGSARSCVGGRCAARACGAKMAERDARRKGGAPEWPDFARFAQNQLYSELARKAVILLSGQFDAQAYLPTQPPPPLQGAWLSRAHEDQGWRRCAVAPSGQGTAPCLRVAGLPRLTTELSHARLLPQCLFPLPLRCQPSLPSRRIRTRRLVAARRPAQFPRLRATGGCTSMPTISACTRRAGNNFRHR